jgi:hypothetical protein
MTDPYRSDRPSPAADVPERERDARPERDRDARIDQLLLAGLDHYFAGHHELAISVWTRVLFLNHGHARARAYIDRARSAISERQRESDELLQTGFDAFARGDGLAARRLLTSAVERGAPTEEALAVLERLTRLESAGGPSLSDRHALERIPVATIDATLQADAAPSRLRWVAAGVASGAIVAAAAAWLWFRGADTGIAQATTSAPAAVASDSEPLPVPAASEASIARARALQARGHLREALAALDGVRHGDALWLEADTLRGVIQKQLMNGAGSPVPRLYAPQPPQDQGPGR